MFVLTGLDYWTGLLDWTTGLTLGLTFELFLLSMIKIAVVLLAKLNLGIWGMLSGYLAKILNHMYYIHIPRRYTNFLCWIMRKTQKYMQLNYRLIIYDQIFTPATMPLQFFYICTYPLTYLPTYLLTYCGQ